MEKVKCIIFGASAGGMKAYAVLCKDYDVIGFSDNNSQKWGTKFCGKNVFEPVQLVDLEDCEVIIASVYYASIFNQLLEMNIKKVRVFYRLGNTTMDNTDDYKLFQLPKEKLFASCNYNTNFWKRLSTDFSINYGNESNAPASMDLVKQAGGKKVLFCAYIFPPLGGSGVQRSLKFVKYLRKYGYEPIVLTIGENNKRISYDTSLMKEVLEDIMVIRVNQDIFLPELLSKNQQQEIINLYGGIVQSYEWLDKYQEIQEQYATQFIPDNQIIWVNECLRTIEGLVDLTQIDVVFTTGNPFSTYLLGYYLKGKYGMRWVQDYRDPWMTNKYYMKNYYKGWKRTEDLQRILEKSLTRKADAIITVEEALREEYTDEYDILPEKVFAIMNGYDEEDFCEIESIPDNSRFTLCHNGTVYIDRNPIKVLLVINELIQEGKILPTEIQWIFNGEVEKSWKEKMDALDKYQIIHYNGYLSHAKSISIAISSDILVMLGVSGEDLPTGCSGKIFEYMRMMRPILNLSSDRTSKEVISRTQTGESFGYDDSEGIRRFILQHFEAWKTGENDFQCDQSEIVKYSREYETKLLAGIFDHLLQKDGNSKELRCK